MNELHTENAQCFALNRIQMWKQKRGLMFNLNCSCRVYLQNDT